MKEHNNFTLKINLKLKVKGFVHHTNCKLMPVLILQGRKYTTGSNQLQFIKTLIKYFPTKFLQSLITLYQIFTIFTKFQYIYLQCLSYRYVYSLLNRPIRALKPTDGLPGLTLWALTEAPQLLQGFLCLLKSLLLILLLCQQPDLRLEDLIPVRPHLILYTCNMLMNSNDENVCIET